MGEIAEIAERRTHKRFLAKERALVYIKSGSYGMLYHLIEISNGGLSFRSLGEDVLINGSSELSIVIEDNFYITEIPVKTVSDTLLIKGYIPLRRRGVRFGQLSSMQKSQLTDFIKKYTK